MSTIRINTTQNVQLDYELASMGERMLAVFIDGLFKIGIYGVILIVVSVLDSNYKPALHENWLDWSHPGFLAFFTFLMIALGFNLFYHLIFESLGNGQSLGKRTVNIRVIRTDGNRGDLGSYLLRWLFRPVDIQFMLGLPLMAITQHNQRLGDILGGTAVIKTRPRQKNQLIHTIYIPKQNADYQVLLPGVSKLNATDIALIKEVVNQEDYRNNTQLLSDVAQRVRQLIRGGENLADRKLLYTVLKDYNFVNLSH